MSEVGYREYKKKQPGGRYVWGVLRTEGSRASAPSAREKELGARP
jgi:hypothetical protein